jgi:hypothetical protein
MPIVGPVMVTMEMECIDWLSQGHILFSSELFQANGQLPFLPKEFPGTTAPPFLLLDGHRTITYLLSSACEVQLPGCPITWMGQRP